MRYLYTALGHLAIPFVLLRVFWRSRRLPAYRERLSERFGYYKGPRLARSIWIHTVSVGEFMAALPLIKALLKSYPHLPLVVTTTTPTGAEQVFRHFSTQVIHVYTPYDLPQIVHRFFEHFHPQIGIIMETELWPNSLHRAQKLRIPLLLANARLSARSAHRYARITSLTQGMLNCLSYVAAQNPADGQRFLTLGLPEGRLHIVGNIKFDLEYAPDWALQGKALKQSWGGGRFILTAASTHEGEEAVVLRLFKVLKAEFPDLLLLLVPRHQDRFDKVFQGCRQEGWRVARRSQASAWIHADTDILLGDTMGELKLLYAASDLVVMGGSWVPIGGHNFIEPAVFGIPCITGPHLHNFVALRDLLVNAHALAVVDNEKDLENECRRLITHTSERRSMGERAQQVVEENQGALQRHLDLIGALINA